MSESSAASSPSSTRRNFLKLVGSVAAGSVITEYSTEVASALQRATDGSKEVVWLQGQTCSACTMSTLQGASPSLEEAISRFKLDVTYHPELMAETGRDAIEAMSDSPDVLMIEGAIPTKIPSAATFGRDEQGRPKPIVDWVMELAPEAEYVMGIGTCACYGGWQSAQNGAPAVMDDDAADGPWMDPNVTGAKGVQYTHQDGDDGVLGPEFTANSGLPVVNVPGCMTHPDYVLLTVATLLNGHEPDLDEFNRPKAFYGPLVHDQCSRRGYFDRGEFVDHVGEDSEKCLYTVGCKGPYCHCDDSVRLWNDGTSVCRNVGAPCIGCMEPGFWDRMTPFYSPIEKQGLGVTDFETAGKAAVGATVAGTAAHAARKAMGYGDGPADDPADGDGAEKRADGCGCGSDCACKSDATPDTEE
ncbi:hydrogenase small subunit [Halorussus halobius]|uniref:hydrogenase small subunit n=1 Tax=Halorussus halobius TaxID=1710537 RepID=UPI0010923D78|nr:[NiFe] hydrogenase small subunit HydA [Halorussus halobius]